jgi:hypothetical protein
MRTTVNDSPVELLPDPRKRGATECLDEFSKFGNTMASLKEGAKEFKKCKAEAEIGCGVVGLL